MDVDTPRGPGTEPRHRRRDPAWSWTGLVLALAGYIDVLRPTLLPRSALLQGLVCALALVTGYAIGATLGAVARRVVSWRPSPVLRRAGWVALVVLAVVAGVLTWPRMGDQADQAASIGAPASAPSAVVVVVVAVGVAWLLLTAARGVRRLTTALGRRWQRAVPAEAGASALGVVSVTLLLVVVVIALYGATAWLFGRLDASTQGQVPPTSPLRSGGPSSLVPWDTLGNEGRSFVSGGPTSQELAAFAGTPTAPEPIRVFAGLDSAPDASGRAALAVEELQRTGGLDRGTVVVITTTGNGFVDPVAAASLEYVLAGDVASVAIQYSVLPSWLSFLVGQAASEEAGVALYDAVRSAVQARPPGERPRLVVYGESLGAFGSQAAFEGLQPDEVVEQVDGALWVGPPFASGTWQQWSAQDEGGVPWQPVVDGGRTVRFAATAEAISAPAASWGPRRILFAQNATDPVVWWTPELALSFPDWLDQPRGPGVPALARWWPLLFMQQTLLDLPAAVSAPAGAGHDYSRQVPVGWVAVLQPAGWTDADTRRLLDTVG